MNDEFSDNDNKTLSVEEARQWYENHKGKTVFEFRLGKEENAVKLHPNWNKSSSKKNDKYEVIETAIMGNKPFNFVDKGCLDKYVETQDARYVLSKTTFGESGRRCLYYSQNPI